MATSTAPAPPPPLGFQALWANYPNHDPCVNPVTHKKANDDQCAIRLGLALQKSGVNFASFTGPRCEFGPKGNGMVLRAEGLAAWLQSQPFPGCPAPQMLPGKGFQKFLAGRTGIAFFEDYWFRAENKKYPTGDHIDLWNRDRLTPSFESFMRFTLGIPQMRSLNPFARGNWFSDLENSRRVMFWSVS